VHEYEAWRDQFRNEAIAPIQNKVGQFLSSNIVRNVVGQQRSTINIFDIMNQKKIFLVNVSKGRIGEDNSALLGSMLITKIQLSAMERVRIPENKREDFYLFVDEFQNFVTDSFASILSEARKYRLCLTLAHQYVAQLETESGSAVKDAVFGNVGTMVIFRVGAEDAEALEKEFEPEFVVEDFVNLPNYHIYTKLMVDGVTSRPFSAKTLPPLEVHESKETEQYIIDTSRKLYTRPRSEVEEEINRWSSTVPGQGGSSTTSDGGHGAETVGKFRAECTNCKKSIYVPFEPEPGLPIYCKECLFKIKQGELEPAPGFRPPKEKKDNISYDALAALGIEFTGGSQKQRNDWGERPRVRPVSERPDLPPVGVIKAGKDDLPLPRGAFKKPVTETSQKAQKPETIKTVEAADIPRTPPPRVVKMPISKERKAPDTAGLRNILNQALQNTISQAKPQSHVSQIVEEKVKEELATTSSQESISLSALKKDAVAVSPVFMTPKKDAAMETKDTLKAALREAGVAVLETNADSGSGSSATLEQKEEPMLIGTQHEEMLRKEQQELREREQKALEEKKKVEEEKQALLEQMAKEKEEALERARKVREEEQKKFEAEKEALRLEEERKRKEHEATLKALHEQNLRREQEEKERLLIAAKEAEAARKQAEEQAEKAAAEALKRAEEAERLTREKEAALLLEQNAKHAAEQAEVASMATNEKTAGHDTDTKSSPNVSHKEVPEDILRQILD
jgi:CxxC-x17-CxxC domain-containing protein